MLMGKLHQDTTRLRQGFDVARQLIRLALKDASVSLAGSSVVDPESKR